MLLFFLYSFVFPSTQPGTQQELSKCLWIDGSSVWMDKRINEWMIINTHLPCACTIKHPWGKEAIASSSTLLLLLNSLLSFLLNYGVAMDIVYIIHKKPLIQLSSQTLPPQRGLPWLSIQNTTPSLLFNPLNLLYFSL